MNDIQSKITHLTDKLMTDYGKGRVIDEIKMFEYPNRDIVIDILERRSSSIPAITATANTAPTRSKTTFRSCLRILFST